MTSPEKLATPDPVIELIEKIAVEWDGCEYDAPGESLDIGDAIRRKGFPLAHALRLATQRQGEGDGWQPIETAPKDGRTLLLGYFNSHGKWRTLRGQWFSEAHINDNWEEECEEGWYETSVECGDDVNCWKTEPTHFMFLPAAPGATSQGVAVAQPDAPPAIKNKGVAFRDWETHPLYKSATAMGHFDAGWMRCLAATTSKD